MSQSESLKPKDITRTLDDHSTIVERHSIVDGHGREIVADVVDEQWRDRLITAWNRRPSTADRGVDETGWLAELQGEAVPQWAILAEDYDEHWTTDAAKALRFARKADAEAFIAHHAWTRVVATEHMWPRIRPHEWAERFGLTCCLQCGNVKNDTSHLRSCKGVVNVGLRSKDTQP